MITIARTRMILALTALLLIGCAQSFSQTDQAKPGVAPLITATDLKKLIDSGSDEIRILEPGQKAEVYQNGHLPTAQFIHWINDMTDPKKRKQYNNLDAEQFAKLMNRLGISNNQRVIIYDRLSSRLSTRLYWTFKYFGHDQVQILDGGIYAWQSQFALATDNPEVTTSEYKVARTRREILAEMEFIGSQLKNPNTRLIDGRPAEQFSGTKPGKVFHTNQEHPRKGHIPGAVNILWKDNFHQDGTFKSADDLQTLYQNAGVLPDQCVITYCNEGLHAAPPWFVLTQLLDYKKVRLYDSSLAEWANSDQPMDLKE